MISDLRSAHLGPCQLVAREPDLLEIPNDIYYSISMGADIGHLPQDSLVTMTGLDESRAPARKAFIGPGDFCVVAGKDQTLPIVLDGEEHGLFFGGIERFGNSSFQVEQFD